MLFLPLFSISLLTAPPPAVDMRVRRDVPYVDSAAERQKLDVYAPARGKNRPIVFWIHGGGWQAGDKREMGAKPQAFVDRGYVFVSTNYRLLPQATIGQMGEDVAKAIRWTHDYAREFGGDRNRLLVMGHSAGAQLAALICTDEHYLKDAGVPFSIVKGCVPVDGDTYDVPLQIATVTPATAARYRAKFGDEASQKALSPVTHVVKGKRLPPFLIIHVARHPETELQSNRLAAAIKAAGGKASTYPAEDTEHVKLDANLGTPGDAASKALFDFVERSLGRK